MKIELKISVGIYQDFLRSAYRFPNLMEYHGVDRL
jgi:hypothetical protein